MIKQYKDVYKINIETINGIVSVVLDDYQINKLVKALTGFGDDGK